MRTQQHIHRPPVITVSKIILIVWDYLKAILEILREHSRSDSEKRFVDDLFPER